MYGLESDAWLQALPISSLGLRLEDASLRIAVGLRLGTAICATHQHHHCGVEVDGRGFHGLICRHSEGRHHRHGTANSIVHNALVSAKIPSQLESAGLFGSDGKFPDGMNMHRPMVLWPAACLGCHLS